MRLGDRRDCLYPPTAEGDPDGVAAGCVYLFCLFIWLAAWLLGALFDLSFWACLSPHSAGADGRVVRFDRLLRPWGPATVVMACICPLRWVSMTAWPLEESAGGGTADVGPGPDTTPTLPPLQPLTSAIERGAVSREDAGQQCTVAGPLVAVGGGGASVCLAFLLGYYLSSHSCGAGIRMWALWCESWVRRRMNTQVLCSFLVLCLCKH